MAAGQRRALIFPGQGSQEVGMGREIAEAFPSAREVFREAGEILVCRVQNPLEGVDRGGDGSEILTGGDGVEKDRPGAVPA